MTINSSLSTLFPPLLLFVVVMTVGVATQVCAIAGHYVLLVVVIVHIH